MATDLSSIKQAQFTSAEGSIASISTAGTGPDSIGAGTHTVEVSAGAAGSWRVGITAAAEITSAAVIMVAVVITAVAHGGGGHAGGGHGGGHGGGGHGGGHGHR